MSDKPETGKHASVLGSLPATRPNRMGRRPARGRDGAAAPKPRPAKAATPKPAAPAAKPRPAAPPEPAPAPPGAVTTAVQAVGEVAQIGVTLTGQALRRAARRLPRL